MEATVQDARSKLKLAERLFAAKKRRWEAAQEPPRPAEAPEAVQGVVSHLRGRHRAEYSSAAVRVRRDRGRKGVAQSCLLPVHYGAARMRAPAPLHVGVYVSERDSQRRTAPVTMGCFDMYMSCTFAWYV